MKSKKINKQTRIDQAREYIKNNTWRRFLKYKVMELGIIPISALAIWKLPYWTGRGIANLFNIDRFNSEFFCQALDGTINCSESVITMNIWLFGFLILILTGFFLAINWYFAKENIEEEAKRKYNVDYFDLKYGESI